MITRWLSPQKGGCPPHLGLLKDTSLFVSKELPKEDFGVVASTKLQTLWHSRWEREDLKLDYIYLKIPNEKTKMAHAPYAGVIHSLMY